MGMKNWCAAAIWLALAHAALAQTDGPARGTIVSAQEGDIACYLRIRDTTGQTGNWMAGFDLCPQARRALGREVGLQWRSESVMHPSCQGDTSCRRTQRVLLVAGILR